MSEKPQLVMDASAKGEPMVYRCSACSQIFLPPKHRAPRDVAVELWAAFKQHLQEKHSDELPADWDVSSRADGPQEAQAGGDAASTSPGELKERKLIAAAHRVSEEVGQELEAILKTGPSDENLARLHAKIVKAAKDSRTAERIYSAIFAALHPP